MISAVSAELTVTAIVLLTIAVGALGYIHGRGDHRTLNRLRETWREEVATELHAEQRKALERARVNARAAAREECGCADADRQIAEAGQQRDEMRTQLDILSRRMRHVQQLADGGGLIRADQLARAVNGIGSHRSETAA